MPQPMSTPTAAGMIAPTVGITEPTVAPLPRWASGMSARCGRTNGIDAVCSACALVCSSRIDAQLSSRSLIRSTAPSSPLAVRLVMRVSAGTRFRGNVGDAGARRTAAIAASP